MTQSEVLIEWGNQIKIINKFLLYNRIINISLSERLSFRNFREFFKPSANIKSLNRQGSDVLFMVLHRLQNFNI